MLKELRAGLALLAVSTLTFGVGYPLLMTGAGQALFTHQANGSLVESEGRIIGSALIGQAFISDKYFHPRPSAAGGGYDAGNSMGSNLAPSSKDLMETLAERANELGKENGLRPIPVDLATASGSGLDPHISVAAALFQAPRVASARAVQTEQIEALIARHTEGRPFGFLGEKRVNVLEINRALDAAFAGTAAP